MGSIQWQSAQRRENLQKKPQCSFHHPHALPLIHLSGSRAPRHRATTSRPRMKPPIQKEASPDITRRDERATFPAEDRGADGTKRRQPYSRQDRTTRPKPSRRLQPPPLRKATMPSSGGAGAAAEGLPGAYPDVSGPLEAVVISSTLKAPGSMPSDRYRHLISRRAAMARSTLPFNSATSRSFSSIF